MTIRFQDLAYEQLRDGTIRIEQIDYAGEAAVIDMHPVQLRHLAEFFELVAPSYPADELTKLIAHQLCEIRERLRTECHHSPALTELFARLDAYCNCLPVAVSPSVASPNDSNVAQSPPSKVSTTPEATAISTCSTNDHQTKE